MPTEIHSSLIARNRKIMRKSLPLGKLTKNSMIDSSLITRMTALRHFNKEYVQLLGRSKNVLAESTPDPAPSPDPAPAPDPPPDPLEVQLSDSAPISVSILDTDSGKKYQFEGETLNALNKIYTVSRGKTYKLTDISQNHPLAIVDLNENEKIKRLNVAQIVPTGKEITVSVSSGMKFLFDGSEPTTTFVFIKGATYIFNLNITGPHLFRIQKDSDLTNIADDNFPSGIRHTATNGIVSEGPNTRDKLNGTLTFTVPIDETATVYHYLCPYHEGMTRTINVVNKRQESSESDQRLPTTYYYGDITIVFSAAFETASIRCMHHGYMGGENVLKYVE